MTSSLRAGRLRARFSLAHVQERADDQLRRRWQHRLDAGEEVWCWRCRMQGAMVRIDARHWSLGDPARLPECPACEREDRDDREDAVRPATAAGSGWTR